MRLVDVSMLKEWIENWFTINRYYHPYSTNNKIPKTELYDIIEQIPTIRPVIKPLLDYRDCAEAMLKLWAAKVVTDEEYNNIMDRLNVRMGVQRR